MCEHDVRQTRDRLQENIGNKQSNTKLKYNAIQFKIVEQFFSCKILLKISYPNSLERRNYICERKSSMEQPESTAFLLFFTKVILPSQSLAVSCICLGKALS